MKTLLIAVSVVWLTLVFLWSGMTLKEVCRSGKSNWSLGMKFADNVHQDMLDNCWQKDVLVNVNGGWTRVLGQRFCNGVYRLKGRGKLFGDSPARLSDAEVAKRCRALAQFRDFAERWGGRMLYLQPPYGIDKGKTMLPAGVLPGRVNGDENADRVVGLCRKAGVSVLDLRSSMASTPSEVEESFYMTDHHWRIEAVFKAFPKILDKLRELGVIEEGGLWDESKWRYVFRPGFFLGYWGRRTGQLFSGLDDFGYYEIDTGCMSLAVPSLNYLAKGPFNEVVIFRKHLQGETSTANRNAVYMGENVPLVVVRNPEAKADKKVLIMKDSFARPLIAFLSTVFREVHAIDPRLYKADVSEYAAGVKPDCVLICYNPVAVSNKNAFWFDFGRCDSIPDLSHAEKVVDNLRVSVSGGKSEWAYKRVPLKLDACRWYRVSFRIDAPADVVGVTVRLYDCKLNKYTNTTIFPNDGSAATKEWVFRTGANPMQLVLYAGIAGKTAGKSTRYFDVGVERVAEAEAARFGCMVAAPVAEVVAHLAPAAKGNHQIHRNARCDADLPYGFCRGGDCRPGADRTSIVKYANGAEVKNLAMDGGTKHLYAVWRVAD